MNYTTTIPPYKTPRLDECVCCPGVPAKPKSDFCATCEPGQSAADVSGHTCPQCGVNDVVSGKDTCAGCSR